MALLLAAKVWHYWISIALLVPILLVVVGVLVGYLIKVIGPRYPRR
jgi:hypothetical protein